MAETKLTPQNCIEPPNLVDISTLKNDKYWLSIHGAPKELSWNITGIFIPGMSVGYEQFYVKDFPINTPGDTISTEACVLEFKISSNIKNYLYFILWMQALIKDTNETKDIHIHVTDSNNTPKETGFKLKNVFPIDLSGIKFSIEEDTVDLRATATMMLDTWHVTMNGVEITDNYEFVIGKTNDCSIEEVKKELMDGNINP